MDDYEAYGQLRDRPLPQQQPPTSQPVPPGAAPRPVAPSQAVARKPKRSHWIRNIALLIVAYFAVAVVTTVQPLPVPGTGMRVAAPFPGGAALLFDLPNRPYTVLVIGLDRRPTESGASRTDTIL